MYGKGLFADIERGLFVELGSGFACLYLALDTSEKSRCGYKNRVKSGRFFIFRLLAQAFPAFLARNINSTCAISTCLPQ